MMCCMTSHHLNAQFPSAIRERLISLPDIVFDQLSADQEAARVDLFEWDQGISTIRKT